MNSFRVALDVMGGDNAPDVELEGARQAIVEDGMNLLLVGPEETINRSLQSLPEHEGSYEVLNATESIAMDEDPVDAVRHKKDASLLVAADAVKDSRADVLVSAGNTGAVMAATKIKWGVQKTVRRPAIATLVPVAKKSTGYCTMIDVGANVDCSPKQLVQFALMGIVFAETVLGKTAPTVGLLNIGGEVRKGNKLTREAFDRLENQNFNFIGNVEGGDIPRGKADVVVTDGFVGNVALKLGEGVIETMFSYLKENITSSWRGKIGGWFLKPIFRQLKNFLDSDEYGSAPLLGLKEGCMIAHGSSSPKAIRNALKSAELLVETNCNEKIGQRIETLKFEE